MAKGNKAVQIIEEHLEKIVLAIAAGLMIYVVVTRFVMSPGIESAGSNVSINAYVDNAATQAESVARQLNSTDASSEELPDLPQLAGSDLFTTEPLAIAGLPPLGPPVGELIDQEVQQAIEIPAMPEPADTMVELYRTQYVERASTYGMMVPGGAATQPATAEVTDVDFITVEAQLPMGAIRQSWERRFKNPRLERQPRYPDPIIATVQLQRSRLEPSGSWGDWQDVPRLANDPMANNAIPSETFSGYNSLAEYQAVLRNRQAPEMQLAVLQPAGMPLPNNTQWAPPSQMEVQRQAMEDAARGRRPGVRGQPQPRGGNVPPPDFGMPMEPQFAPPNFGMPGAEFGMPPGFAPGGFGPGGGATGVGSEELQKDTVSFWAHDASGRPGEVYRYRIRVAAFNPIAGRNWFTPEQQDLKDQVLLWTPWLQPEKIVRVPDRILFFPKPRTASTNAIGVDVYRWEHGVWYRKTFSVARGTMIGRVDIPERQGQVLQAAEPPRVDFRTDHLLLDIIPQEVVYSRRGSNIQQVDTAMLVVADPDGQTQRIPVTTTAWPSDLRNRLTRVRDAYDGQVQRVAPGGRGGQPGMPGGDPGMFPPGF